MQWWRGSLFGEVLTYSDYETMYYDHQPLTLKPVTTGFILCKKPDHAQGYKWWMGVKCTWCLLNVNLNSWTVEAQ